MRHIAMAVGALFLAFSASATCQDTCRKDVEHLIKEGRGSAAGRAAWDRLSAAGPNALMPLLEAMDTADTVRANWLRTAFDRIVERELKTGGKRIDADKLLAYVRDARKQGRARRLALDVIEALRPGTRDKLIDGWLNDPEFRFEAVARLLQQAQAAPQRNSVAEAREQFRTAFNAARDQQQLRDAAAGLAQLGVTVSVAQRMGFLTDWYVIGPFDGMGKQGFRIAYPPERTIDLRAELSGQQGKVRWKRYHIQEPNAKSRGGHQALVNLRDKAALGDADDAVAFAYTEFTVPNAVQAEFRGAADDNFTVWVNGVRVFGFEEWRNGVRLDRHRFKVNLKAGKNTVLVKVCQTPAPNPEPNWEFFLRVVDSAGQGIAMTATLPE